MAFAVEGVPFFLWLALIPADNKDVGFLGLSPFRLVLMAFLFGASFGFWILSRAQKKQEYISNLFQKKASGIGRKLTIFVATSLFIGAIFFGLHWLLLAEDDFLNAYLQRFSPFVSYLGIISFQALYFLYTEEKNKIEKKKLVTFLLGMLAFIPWLLVGEYFVTDTMFPNYYVAQGFYTQYQTAFFFALLTCSAYFQFILTSSKQGEQKKRNFTWLLIPLFIILGFFYYNATNAHAQTININFMSSDQHAYMEITEKAIKTNFSYTGTRNQMPLYSYLQALFYRPEMGKDILFERGKTINIILSLILLGGIFILSTFFFHTRRAVIITLVTTVSIFIFKAPYFQAELLYYFLSLIAFLGMGKMLIQPSLKLGVGIGLVLGLAHLTKASALPMLLAFSTVFLLQQSVFFFNERRATKKNRLQKSSQALGSFFLTLFSFVLVLSPYLKESKERYGHYFYNVNSTFYIWYDSWDEAVADTEKYGYREHYPDLSADELPGLRKYLREHSLEQITIRFLAGLKIQLSLMLLYPFSKFNYLLLYGVAILLLFIYKKGWNDLKKLLMQYWAVIIFTILIITGYLTLYAWYTPFAGGTRFIYSIFLPALFAIYIAFDKISKTLNTTAMATIFDKVVFALLIADFYYVTFMKLPSGYFGS